MRNTIAEVIATGAPVRVMDNQFQIYVDGTNPAAAALVHEMYMPGEIGVQLSSILANLYTTGAWKTNG